MQEYTFMDYLHKIGCSDHSIKFSIKVISEFECYLKEHYLEFETLNQREIERYIEELIDKNQDDLDRLKPWPVMGAIIIRFLYLQSCSHFWMAGKSWGIFIKH